MLDLASNSTRRPHRRPWLSITAVCSLLLPAGAAHAETHPGDPFAYDLRIALQPLAFQGGVTQRWFGPSARIEFAPVHWLDLAVDGRLAVLAANHLLPDRSYWLRAGFAIHVAQALEEQALYGTVYAADPPAISPGPVGVAEDLREVPVDEKLRGPSIGPLDRDVTLSAAMRRVHSLRFAVAYTQVMERARPDVDRWARNSMPLLQLGYSFATHWNLPRSVTGKRELGYRRFYLDAMLTTAALTKSSPTRLPDNSQLDFVPIGARAGMQGAIEGLLESAPELGFAYDLEIGMYPGRGGLEGYLFLALGVAFEVATR